MKGSWTLDRRRQPNGDPIWTEGRDVQAYCPQIGEWLPAVVMCVESRQVRITGTDPVWRGAVVRATKLRT